MQADLKTFHRMGVYGEAVITLITVQNTRGLHRTEVLAPELVAEQIARGHHRYSTQGGEDRSSGKPRGDGTSRRQAASFAFPLVIDPVMIGKNGLPLLDQSARAEHSRSDCYRERFC